MIRGPHPAGAAHTRLHFIENEGCHQSHRGGDTRDTGGASLESPNTSVHYSASEPIDLKNRTVLGGDRQKTQAPKRRRRGRRNVAGIDRDLQEEVEEQRRNGTLQTRRFYPNRPDSETPF